MYDIPLHFVVVLCFAPLGRHSFLDFPCFWWSSQFWRKLLRYFVEWPSVRIRHFFSHDSTGVVVSICEADQRDKMPSSLSHVKGIYYQHDSSPLTFTLVIWLEVESVRFLNYKVTLFLSFSHLSLSRKVTVHSSHLSSGKLCSTSLRSQYPHKLFKLLHRRLVCFLPSIYLFSHLYHYN